MSLPLRPILAILIPALLPALASAADARLAADAYISTNSPNGNFGGAASVHIGGPGARRALLRFDLSTLPPGSTGASVARANLVIFADQAGTGSTFNVVRLNSPWAEGTVSNNSVPIFGTAEVTAVPLSADSSFAAVDVTALVKAWLNGTLANNGLALVPNAAGSQIDLDSRENSTTGHYARLDIILNGPAGPQGNLATAGETSPPPGWSGLWIKSPPRQLVDIFPATTPH